MMSTQFSKISYSCRLEDLFSFSNLVIYIFLFFILYIHNSCFVCNNLQARLSAFVWLTVCMQLGCYIGFVYTVLYTSLCMWARQLLSYADIQGERWAHHFTLIQRTGSVFSCLIKCCHKTTRTS